MQPLPKAQRQQFGMPSSLMAEFLQTMHAA
jgi:hypothetical protein